MKKIDMKKVPHLERVGYVISVKAIVFASLIAILSVTAILKWAHCFFETIAWYQFFEYGLSTIIIVYAAFGTLMDLIIIELVSEGKNKSS